MKGNLAGNLANQKYEASRNIERHLKIISGDVPPTWETSRWRKYQPEYNFHKQKGRMVVEERRVNADNHYMSERIDEIVNERRQEGTHEYAPGWRVGRGGTCIDCYPSESHALTMRNMANAQALARNFAKGLVEKSNVQVHRFINSAKSSYPRKDHAEFYKRNRVVYKIFMDRTPVTSLHLGLVRMAKKNIARRNRIAAIHHAQIEAANLDNSTDDDAGNEDIAAGHRPQTAPAAVSKGVHTGFSQEVEAFKQAEEQFRAKKNKEEQKTNKKVKEVVATINKPEDLFTAKETIREIRNRNYPWDNATNDNYFNSGRNDGQDRKHHSIWDDPVQSAPKLTLDKTKKRPQTASGELSTKSKTENRHYLDAYCPNILEVAAAMQQQKEEEAAASRPYLATSPAAAVTGPRSFYAPSPQSQSQQHQQQRQRPSTTNNTPNTQQGHRPPLPTQVYPSSAGSTPYPSHFNQANHGIASPADNFSPQEHVQMYQQQHQQQYIQDHDGQISSWPTSAATSPMKHNYSTTVDSPNETQQQEQLSEDAYHQQRLRKLQALRKNVSFVADINVIEFDENNKMTMVAVAATSGDNALGIDGDAGLGNATKDPSTFVKQEQAPSISLPVFPTDNVSVSSTISGGSNQLSPSGRPNRASQYENENNTTENGNSSSSNTVNNKNQRGKQMPPLQHQKSYKSNNSRLSPLKSSPQDNDSPPNRLNRQASRFANADNSRISPTDKRKDRFFAASEASTPDSKNGENTSKNSVDGASMQDASSPITLLKETIQENENEKEEQKADSDNFILNVEDILRALKPHDEFLLDFNLDISSKFPFFIRKDGLVSGLVEYDHVPLSYCDSHGKEVAILPVKVAVMIYDVGYILSGGANTTNMFSTPTANDRPTSAQSNGSGSIPSFSPTPSRPVSALSQHPTGAFSPTHKTLPHLNSSASSSHYPMISPNGQVRIPRTQRLSMTLASLKNHPMGLPTSAGILVAVRIVSSPTREEVPKEVLERGAYRDFAGSYGHVFLTVNQLALRRKAFPRDSSVLTVIHEMQSFAYPYSGIDQILTQPALHHLQNQHAALPAHLVNASTNRLNHLFGSSRGSFAMSRQNVHMGSAGTDSGINGRRALAAGDKHRMSSAGVTATGFAPAPTEFAGQHILTVDEGQKHAVVYPCLLDMCDTEAIDSLVQPILATLRLEFEESESESQANSTRTSAYATEIASKNQSVMVIGKNDSINLNLDVTDDSTDGHESESSPRKAAQRIAAAMQSSTRKKRTSIHETIEMIERGEFKHDDFGHTTLRFSQTEQEYPPAHLTVRCLC